MHTEEVESYVRVYVEAHYSSTPTYSDCVKFIIISDITQDLPLIYILKIGHRTRENKAPSSIAKAIQLGYRYIDTAQTYFNEELVGKGIEASGISIDKWTDEQERYTKAYAEGT